ncbi:MAG: hypothetical protein OSB51_11365 [Dokdonia donghaensis]|jgi:hypothetical protein|nr:hypothetical protein [Dokdonia donghaensis]
MKKILAPLLLTILSISIVSCEKEVVYETNSARYTTSDIALCATQQCPDIDIDIITFSSPETVKDIANKWILDKTTSTLYNASEVPDISITDAIDLYINESQISYPETTELSDAHEIQIETAISYGTNNLLSIVHYTYQFSGGASGYDTASYLNLNPQNGELLSKEALFTEDFYAFAKAYFTKEYPQQAYIFNNPTFYESLKEVGFTDVGVVLYYINLDALQSENMVVTIPWEEAESYLTF